VTEWDQRRDNNEGKSWDEISELGLSRINKGQT